MTQAKCVLSTPPTSSSALPVDPTRRRSVIYDRVELARTNRAPIARVVAQELSRLGKAVVL
jgi:hypothetical protein